MNNTYNKQARSRKDVVAIYMHGIVRSMGDSLRNILLMFVRLGHNWIYCTSAYRSPIGKIGKIYTV